MSLTTKKMNTVKSFFLSVGAACFLTSTGASALSPPPGNTVLENICDYRIISDWGTGFQAEVSITAEFNDLSDWQINWTFPGNQQIDTFWSSNILQLGNEITADPAAWNSHIPTSGQASFGFIGSYSGVNAIPELGGSCIVERYIPGKFPWDIVVTPNVPFSLHVGEQAAIFEVDEGFPPVTFSLRDADFTGDCGGSPPIAACPAILYFTADMRINEIASGHSITFHQNGPTEQHFGYLGMQIRMIDYSMEYGVPESAVVTFIIEDI